MEPRLKYSSQWTAVPSELISQIQDLFVQNFTDSASEGQFYVSGRIYLNEVLIQVGYRKHNEIKQNNFEISIEYNRNKDNMMQMIHLGVDCAASLMEQFFSDPEVQFPPQWEMYHFQNRDIYLQLTKTNTDLEEQANALLGLDEDPGLLKGQDDEEELSIKISMLGLDPEDFQDQQFPHKMKNSKSTKKKNTH